MSGADDPNLRGGTPTDLIVFHELLHSVIRGTPVRHYPYSDPYPYFLASPDPTVRLIPYTEAQVVGLGPFSSDPHTERAYRTERNLPMENYYDKPAELSRDGSGAWAGVPVDKDGMPVAVDTRPIPGIWEPWIGAQRGKKPSATRYRENIDAMAQTIADKAIKHPWIGGPRVDKAGFDNPLVRELFRTAAQYRALSPDVVLPVNYEDQLNAAAAGFAAHMNQRQYTVGAGFADDSVKPYLTNLILQKLAEQGVEKPNLQVAFEKVRQAFRDRLRNALENGGDGEKRRHWPQYMDLFDQYWNGVGKFVTNHGEVVAENIAKEARERFERDPFLYLTPNHRTNPDFPWTPVFNDVTRLLWDKLKAWWKLNPDIREEIQAFAIFSIKRARISRRTGGRRTRHHPSRQRASLDSRAP